MRLVIVPPERIVDIAGAPVNPFLTAVVSGSDGADIEVFISRWGSGTHPRTLATCSYIGDLIARRSAGMANSRLPSTQAIVLQMEDNPLPLRGCAFEAKADWHQVRMIPDIYYYNDRGHESFSPIAVPWSERQPAAVWRGSTSGLVDLVVDRMSDLPRHRLCRLAQMSSRLDCRITNVAQAATDAERVLIEDRLRTEQLFGDYIDLSAMSAWRMLIDIDGNANAWNILAKLRLGCCLLKVDSPWRQWIYDRLEPWRHYVPVRADLTDLEERVDWCLANDDEAETIAQQGRLLAEDTSFAREMDHAAIAMFGRHP